MTPNDLFLSQPKSFWAYVRSISQKAGYTARGKGQIKVYTISEITQALLDLGLQTAPLAKGNEPTRMGMLLVNYFSY